MTTNEKKRSPSKEFEQDAKRPKLDSQENSVSLEIEQIPRLKRKMVAMLMAFNGQGYLGMQRNPGVKTIEEDFLQALVKSNAIFPDEYETPQNMRFQRSCRTDKGVSAAQQVVSLKIKVAADLVEKINFHLPPQIRMFGCKRVTQSFNCKTACDARTYSYMLPTYAFAPPQEQQETMENYRISDDVIKHANEVLDKFKGTHRFHNFTAGRAANDASCQRYILEFLCTGPSIRDGIEFVVIKVKGQSFMLHQIRKMIGLTIAIVQGLTTIDTIEKAWEPQRLDIPIAPSLGLVLEEVHYDRYNRRYGDDGLHEPLLWDDQKEALLKFKEDFIYPTIINAEKQEKSMIKWLETLNCHTFDVRDPSEPGDPPNTPLANITQATKESQSEIKQEDNGTLNNQDHELSTSPNDAKDVT